MVLPDREVSGTMGRKVVVSYRILPKEPSVSTESLENQLRKLDAEIKDIEVEPIAFGLKAINAVFLLPDESGAVDELEKKLKNLNGVGEVETLSVTLI